MKTILKIFPKGKSTRFQPFACFSSGNSKVNEIYKTFTETFQNLPDPDQYHLSYVERNEVEARIMKILSYFEGINLKSFKWTDSFEKDLKMDSLDQTVLLTSVEEEFNIVFEDRVFDNLKTLEDVVKYIVGDSMVI